MLRQHDRHTRSRQQELEELSGGRETSVEGDVGGLTEDTYLQWALKDE